MENVTGIIQCSFMNESFDIELPCKDVIYDDDLKHDNQYRSYYRGHVPYFVIYVTDYCNMSCPYCFNKKGNVKRYNKEPIYSINDLKVFLLSLGYTEIFIRFFGGEPLLNKEWIVKCVRILNESKIKFYYNIFTNLTLMDMDFLDFALENDFQFFVSLGSAAKYDPYKGGIYKELIFKNLLILSKKTDNVIASVVWSPDWELSLVNMLCTYKELGLKFIHINTIWGERFESDSINRLEYELEKFAKFYIMSFIRHDTWHIFVHPFIDYIEMLIYEKPGHTNSCAAGNDLAAITTDGNLFPCHCFTSYEEFKVGELKNCRWERLFRGTNVNNVTLCKECNLKFICKAKCYANNYFINNNVIVAVKERCIIEKKIFSCCAFIVKELKKYPTEFQVFKKILKMRLKENVRH